ncbi:MAG: putative glycosyltransferase protein [Herbinix sp.]|jgi:glycosyltransferase involved in cell wall biosynthesis|nr:putative glycosyltransferase protein [Herbinix sp.]
MKVSIVVPVYNVEKYLNECVNSILTQTYTDFEIILVDDGSKDSSGRICDGYAKNERVKVIHKQNAGLGMARNSGIELAKGDYITFLDSDDCWTEDALELLMDGILKQGADTCIGGYTRVTDAGLRLLEEKPAAALFRISDEVKQLFFPRLMGSAPTKKDAFRPSVWNAVYSMKIIRKYNVRFPSEREFIAEDVIFDIDYYRYSKCVCIVDSAGYLYRITPGSLTQRYKADRFEKVVYLYKEVLKRLADCGYDSMCSLRAKRQFFVYIRSCIEQENISISGLTAKEATNNIKRICYNGFTQSCIASYPSGKLQIAQKVFLVFVKCKMSFALYMFLCTKERKGGKA